MCVGWVGLCCHEANNAIASYAGLEEKGIFRLGLEFEANNAKATDHCNLHAPPIVNVRNIARWNVISDFCNFSFGG